MAVVLTALAGPAAADTYSPRVGERHVNFTLPAIDDGRPISLEQLRGKKVLLIQFASW
jgi:peroxiredoxin